MTVKELIIELSKLPQDATVDVASVCGWENCGGELSDVTLNEHGTVVELFG